MLRLNVERNFLEQLIIGHIGGNVSTSTEACNLLLFPQLVDPRPVRTRRDKTNSEVYTYDETTRVNAYTYLTCFSSSTKCNELTNGELRRVRLSD